MPATVWKDKFVVRGYELAKVGMSEEKISRVLGISTPTFRSWMKKKPIFKTAIKQGRRMLKGKGEEASTFRDYIYKRLSPKAREVWKTLNRMHKTKSGIEKVQLMLETQGKGMRQSLFIYAWTSANFNISAAMRKILVGRGTFELWKKDPEFLNLVHEIEWHKKNFFEDHLCMLIKGGDTAATIFANSTYNKDRGYGRNATLKVEGEMTVNRNVMSVDDLELSLEARKEILRAVRHRKKVESEVVEQKALPA